MEESNDNMIKEEPPIQNGGETSEIHHHGPISGGTTVTKGTPSSNGVVANDKKLFGPWMLVKRNKPVRCNIGNKSDSKYGFKASRKSGNILNIPKKDSARPRPGENAKGFRSLIMDLRAFYSISMIILVETQISGAKADKVMSGLSFDKSEKVDARGGARGIWVFWDESLWDVTILQTTTQTITMDVRGEGRQSWVLSTIYGSPHYALKSSLWDCLRSLAENMDKPWCLVGDFNMVAELSERVGISSTSPTRGASNFASFIRDCNLIDLRFVGLRFTWRRGRVKERLDRGLWNLDWRLLFLHASITHLNPLKSDHSHLLVNLTVWNKEVFGDIFKRKNRLLRRLNGITKKLALWSDAFLEHLQTDLWEEYETTSKQEELLWFQKSRSKWFTYGDRNTYFFHASTIIRRKKTQVQSLQNDDAVWISDRGQLESLANSLYKSLYSEDGFDAPFCLSSCFPLMDTEQISMLSASVTVEEIRRAIFSIGSYKALGKYDIQAIFYQNQWNLVGPKLCDLVKIVFEGGPDAVLASRLRGVTHHFTGPYKSSFIPGRQSSDNITITREVIHSMQNKRGSTGWMILRNGDALDPFRPERGIRQSDPIFPYLFVLCMERLSHLINAASEVGLWKPIKICRNDPPLTHLAFANDLIIFVEADLGQDKLQWNLGDGKSVDFLKDNWVPNEGALANLHWASNSVLTYPSMVAEFMNRTGDSLGWKGSRDGSFSVASAYACIASHNSLESSREADLVWAWKGPTE
ncbi:PREDICTED: uncharacterized protein LOC109363517 [Lupinus angustifolius]|uniref:uncharacterized protein LOC109363517 n=1 Tax=Lupinus angustifolius TaxID=3871 RepID=UPI00092E85FA|nr:PREDICTED: uncharacterized protein LOC109363517 [Lupinus angustifolius]